MAGINPKKGLALVNERLAALEDSPGTIGRMKVVDFPFTFDTPGLATGIPVYTPAVGDWLMNAWFETTEAWDGTTPGANLAVGHDPSDYLFYTRSVLMSVEDDTYYGGLLHNFTNEGNSQLSDDLLLYQVPPAAIQQYRIVPAKFVSTEPLNVWVTQSGLSDGDDPESTQGSAILHLVIWSPAEETTAAGIQGEQGIQGEPGPAGADGADGAGSLSSRMPEYRLWTPNTTFPDWQVVRVDDTYLVQGDWGAGATGATPPDVTGLNPGQYVTDDGATNWTVIGAALLDPVRWSADTEYAEAQLVIPAEGYDTGRMYIVYPGYGGYASGADPKVFADAEPVVEDYTTDGDTYWLPVSAVSTVLPIPQASVIGLVTDLAAKASSVDMAGKVERSNAYRTLDLRYCEWTGGTATVVIQTENNGDPESDYGYSFTIAFDDDAAAIQTTIEGVVGAGAVLVSEVSPGMFQFAFVAGGLERQEIRVLFTFDENADVVSPNLVTWQANPSGLGMMGIIGVPGLTEALQAKAASSAAVPMVIRPEAPTNGVAAEWNIEITGSPTGGSFVLGLSIDGGSVLPTEPIAFDASWNDIINAIALVSGGLGADEPKVMFNQDNFSGFRPVVLTLETNNLTGGSSPSVDLTEVAVGVWPDPMMPAPGTLLVRNQGWDAAYLNVNSANQPRWMVLTLVSL